MDIGQIGFRNCLDHGVSRFCGVAQGIEQRSFVEYYKSVCLLLEQLTEAVEAGRPGALDKVPMGIIAADFALRSASDTLLGRKLYVVRSTSATVLEGS